MGMAEFSGTLRYCKALTIIFFSSKRRTVLDDECGDTKKAAANPVINEAFPVDGSAIVNAVVVVDEMLNMPHVSSRSDIMP